jgi:hypothetical protein
MTELHPIDHVNNSKNAANIFYFFLYICFYLSVVLYPNKLKDSLSTNGLYFIYFLVIHLLAAYYFLTAGQNPGFLEQNNKESADVELR